MKKAGWMSPQVNDEPPSDIPGELKRIDHYLTRHGEIMSSYADRLSLMDARLKLVEEYTVTRKIAEAREDERDKALYERLDRMDGKMKTIETDVNGIKGLGTKALGIVGSALLLALVAWVLKGNLV
jgi:hypothetical protein